MRPFHFNHRPSPFYRIRASSTCGLAAEMGAR
jgi:hypothetical protein